MVHSQEDYEAAVEASNILFGNATSDSLKNLDEETFLSVFEGVPQFEVSKAEIESGAKLADLLTATAKVFPSKGEFRKMVQGGGLSINKTKVVDAEACASLDMLLNNKYILVQKGKKNYFLLLVK